MNYGYNGASMPARSYTDTARPPAFPGAQSALALWRVSFREVTHRPGRALLTLLSIVIGVATVVSITIATATTRVAYQEMFAALTGRANLEVTADGGGSFDQSVVQTLDVTPGVKAAAPILQRPTIMHVKGRRVKLVAVGIDPAKDEVVRDYEIGEGTFFENDRDALLEAGFAGVAGDLGPGAAGSSGRSGTSARRPPPGERGRSEGSHRRPRADGLDERLRELQQVGHIEDREAKLPPAAVGLIIAQPCGVFRRSGIDAEEEINALPDGILDQWGMLPGRQLAEGQQHFDAAPGLGGIEIIGAKGGRSRRPIPNGQFARTRRTVGPACGQREVVVVIGFVTVRGLGRKRG